MKYSVADPEILKVGRQWRGQVSLSFDSSQLT